MTIFTADILEQSIDKFVHETKSIFSTTFGKERKDKYDWKSNILTNSSKWKQL